jgi:hypothetical protein
LNKRNLFPMASTKTTRPPRTAIWSFNNATYCKVHGVKWWWFHTIKWERSQINFWLDSWTVLFTSTCHTMNNH